MPKRMLLVVILFGLITAGLADAAADQITASHGPTPSPSPTPIRLSVLNRPPHPTPEPTPTPPPPPTPTPEPTPTQPPSMSASTPTPTAVATPIPSPSPPTPVPTPASSPTPPSSTPEPVASGRPDPATAAAVLSLTNDLRAANGLPPLVADPALTASAQRFAQLMAQNNWFNHDGPDGSTLVSRVESAGYVGWIALSENLYKGFHADSPQDVMRAWTNSSGHLANILSQEVADLGVGCYISEDWRWCVQDFGAR